MVLHGMLGNKKNLRRISTMVAKEYPAYDMLLVTLRAHGDSGRGRPPHSVSACAQDVASLLEAQGVHKPDVVMGHSFGAKVSVP